MSKSPTEYIAETQERTLDAVRQSQSSVIEAVEGWVKAMESVAPELPAIPVLKSLPTADEVVETSFDFQSKLLAAQREFAEKLVSATSPVIKTTPVEGATA